MTTPAIYRFGPVFSHPCRAAKPRFRQSVVMVCLSAGSFLFGADRSLANYVIVGEAIFNDKNEKCDVVKLDSRSVYTTKPFTTRADHQTRPQGTHIETFEFFMSCPNESSINVSTFRFTTPDGTRTTFIVPFLSLFEQAAFSADIAADPYIVGSSPAGSAYSNPYHAFRYDIETGEMLDLSADHPDQTSVARGVSNDGSVVVGWRNSPTSITQRAFRWTEAGGMADLGELIAGGFSLATDVSLDGLVIVGQAASDTEFANGHAFRWTGADGMVDLGGFGGVDDIHSSIATATNGDGSVVVGQASLHAFRWEGGTMADLGTVGGDEQSLATSVSADGSVVVGISSDEFITNGGIGIQYDDISRAFRWTAATDLQDLNVLAFDAGVDVAGITMISATFVSADGTMISGTAFTPESPDERTAYVLRYEDETTGADTISAGFEDLSFGGGGGTLGTFTETQALASLDAADRSLGAAVGLNGAIVALALGRYEPWTSPEGYDLTGFATSGGFGSGVRGFAPLADGVTLYGGLAFARPDFGDVSFGSETVAAVALRYDTSDIISTGADGSSFVEVFGSMGWIDNLALARPYETSGGAALGLGLTGGELRTVGLRAGVSNRIGTQDVLGFAATIGKDWLSTDAFAESASANNPFPASYAAGTSSWMVASVEAQWIRSVSPGMDLTVTAGWNHAFAADGGLTAEFTGIGTVAGTAADQADWVDFGGGLTYKATDTTDVSLFVGGTFGNKDVTPQAYGSLAVTIRF